MNSTGINDIKDKIQKIDEDISDLYLTEYASNKGSYTLKQRIKLYDKIVRLYTAYQDEKKKLSQYEYNYLLEANPEWEIFSTIKAEYLSNEKELIKQLKKQEEETPKEYTKEEIDTWSLDKIRKFLTKKGFRNDTNIIAPKKGKDPDDVRFAYNAYQRLIKK